MRNVHPAILPVRRGLIAAGLSLFASTAGAAARYELIYSPDTERMQIRLCIDATAAVREFRLQRGGGAYIDDLRRGQGELQRLDETRWRAADWKAGE